MSRCEEDLRRRDLTINAMARKCRRRTHRPLRRRRGPEESRVCATCRRPSSRTRCGCCAWHASPRASAIAVSRSRRRRMPLMRSMVASGEIDALVPERVWQETERALGETRPEVFFETLRDCGALAGHLSGDRRALRRAAAGALASGNRHRRTCDAGAASARCASAHRLPVRFAVLMHDLGKAATPRELWPSHHGHEEAGVRPHRGARGTPARAEGLLRACGSDSAPSRCSCTVRSN